MTRLHPRAAAAALACAALAAHAQTAERIEITGSAIKRIDAEGAVPVQVLTREEIARGGFTSTEDLMQSLAVASGMNGTNNASGAGASTYGRSTISLRGLDAGRTLVLVNGRRVAPVAGGDGAEVNVNNIPLAAIERVEVLKDGASSLYGSEALAGVVNFILTRDFRGVDLGIGYGTPTRSGGGQNRKASVVAGFGNLSREGFNLTLSASIEKEKQLFAKDREFAKSGNNFPYLLASATGQGNIEGSYTPGPGTPYDPNDPAGEPSRIGPGWGSSPGRGFGNPMAAAGRCEEINMFLNPAPTSQGAPYCAFDSNAYVGLTPERDVVNLTANGAWRLNDDLELFGDVLWSKSQVIQRFQPSPLRRDFMTPSDAQFGLQGVDPVLLISPSNPNYQFAADYLTAQGFGALVGQPLAVTARVFDFGPRTQDDTTTQSRLLVGARGRLLGQDWELAAMRNESKLEGKVAGGYFSQVAYARAVQQSNDWNPWSLNQSDAFRAAIAPAEYVGKTQDALTRSDIVEGKLTGEAFALPAGPTLYAAGVQARAEKYQTDPSEALFSGDIAGLGGATPPVDRSRRIGSVFGELALPLLKALEASLSGRVDRYNDVGNANTYKAGLRWQPNREFLLRASLGTGFRAPTLQELWLPQSTGTSEQFTDPAFPGTPIQVPLVAGGNPDAKPERSKQRSLGLVLAPSADVNFGIDWWWITVRDILDTPSTQEVVSQFRAGDPAYAGLVTLDGGNNITLVRAILANVGSAKVAGVDLDLNTRHALFGGRLDVAWNGTYMTRYDQTSPGGSLSHKVGTMVDGACNPVLGANLGGVVLRWKHRLAGTWSSGPFAATLAQNLYTGYDDGCWQTDGVTHHRVPTQVLYDAQLAFTGVPNLKLALGVRNLFDKDPPLYIPASNQFQSGYDISLYDPRARFVYLTANYRF